MNQDHNLSCTAAFFSGNQVAQSVRASGHEEDTALSALHANAAWQQGVFAALVAVLDMCSSKSAVVDLHVTEMHVRLACRLLEINLNIRQAWRSQGDFSVHEEWGFGESCAVSSLHTFLYSLCHMFGL